MSTLTQVIFFSLIGGLFSLIGGALLLSRKKTALALAKYATPFAAGAMIAAVFLDLLAEGLVDNDVRTVLTATIVGIMAFYLMERFLRWFHHHHHDDESHQEKTHDATLPLVMAGDTIHNALDGVVIGAAFLVNPAVGITTTIVVAAHEIPQEIGDFGLMLHKGLSRSKAMLANALSAVATTIMAVLTFQLGSSDMLPMGVLIGLSAGFLLYIAMSDIIPELHRHSDKSKKIFDLQPVLMFLGVIVVAIAISVSHNFIGHEHDHVVESKHQTTQDTSHDETHEH